MITNEQLIVMRKLREHMKKAIEYKKQDNSSVKDRLLKKSNEEQIVVIEELLDYYNKEFPMEFLFGKAKQMMKQIHEQIKSDLYKLKHCKMPNYKYLS